MIYSNEGVLAENQELGGSSSTALPTIWGHNTIDLGATGTPPLSAAPANRDVGQGSRIPFRVQVSGDFTRANPSQDFSTTDTLRVEIVVTDTEPTYDSTTGNVAGVASETIAMRSVDVSMADLSAGYVFPMQYLTRGVDKRFVAVRFILSSDAEVSFGGTAATGRMFVGVVGSNEEWYT